MARIYPFRALRYNLAQVTAQDVVTQPYDKISPAMQQAYYQRSPYNLVRIILRMPELFDGEGDLYANAARDFDSWRKAGILEQERQPCVFACVQRFALPGENGVVRERRGFIALGELYDYSREVVFRHEQTLSKPKSDRLNLLRATRAHFGQIFMLYSDPAHSAEAVLFSNGAGETLPDIEVTDEYGVVHRVWKVTDPARINLLTTGMEDKKLIIADGHHRYETALNYARERGAVKTMEACERVGGGLPQPPYPEAAAMMTFVNMDSEGLVILPTHRVVFGLEGFEAGRLLQAAEPYFEVEELKDKDPAAALTRVQGTAYRVQGEPRTAFVAVTASGWHLLTAKREAVAEALKAIPARQRRLDIVQLHGLVLEKLLGISPEAIRDQTHLRYLREAAEATDQVARGEANVAFLMNPVTMEQLREVAFAGEVMPQKSTDFYPKLLSGLAIYALD